MTNDAKTVGAGLLLVTFSVILIGWAMCPPGPEPEIRQAFPSRAEQERRRADRIQRSIDARFEREAAATKARNRATPTVVSGNGTSVETVRLVAGIYIVSYSIVGNANNYGADNFIASVHDRDGGGETLVNEIVTDLEGSVLLKVGLHVGNSVFLSVNATGRWEFKFAVQ